MDYTLGLRPSISPRLNENSYPIYVPKYKKKKFTNGTLQWNCKGWMERATNWNRVCILRIYPIRNNEQIVVMTLKTNDSHSKQRWVWNISLTHWTNPRDFVAFVTSAKLSHLLTLTILRHHTQCTYMSKDNYFLTGSY